LYLMAARDRSCFPPHRDPPSSLLQRPCTDCSSDRADGTPRVLPSARPNTSGYDTLPNDCAASTPDSRALQTREPDVYTNSWWEQCSLTAPAHASAVRRYTTAPSGIARRTRRLRTEACCSSTETGGCACRCHCPEKLAWA